MSEPRDFTPEESRLIEICLLTAWPEETEYIQRFHIPTQAAHPRDIATAAVHALKQQAMTGSPIAASACEKLQANGLNAIEELAAGLGGIGSAAEQAQREVIALAQENPAW